MKTPRIALPLFLLAVISAVAVCQSAAAPPATRLPLWKIEGPKCTVYLLGSVHFLKKENYPLAGPIEEAFEKSKVVAFETDMDAMENPELQASLMSKAMLPEGQTLGEQLSPRLKDQLRKQLAETGVPMEALQSFKPGMVALTIMMVEIQKMNLDPKLGLDKHFHQRAKKSGKEIRGLELPQFQVDLITGLSKEEGEAMLESTLQDIKTLKDELDKLLKSWETGDVKGLAALLNKALEEHPSLFKRMLTDRNKSWIPTIEEMVKGDRDAIVIVGAGHLAGQGSVIELLEKKGVKAVQQ